MAGIKVGAHPMVVAVAMGLLGPSVLFEESAERATPSPAGMPLPTIDPPTLDLEPEPVSADEFARVESLWHSVTLEPNEG